LICGGHLGFEFIFLMFYTHNIPDSIHGFRQHQQGVLGVFFNDNITTSGNHTKVSFLIRHHANTPITTCLSWLIVCEDE